MQQTTRTVLMAFAATLAGGMSIGGAAAEEISTYAPVTQQRLENPEAGNWLAVIMYACCAGQTPIFG